jgi:hypothetical protein
MIISDAFVFELATQGAEAADTGPDLTSADFAQLAAPIDGLSWATPWRTLSGKASPPGTGPVGFAVMASTPGAMTWEGPPAPSVKMEVLVESVAAQ